MDQFGQKTILDFASQHLATSSGAMIRYYSILCFVDTQLTKLAPLLSVPFFHAQHEKRVPKRYWTNNLGYLRSAYKASG